MVASAPPSACANVFVEGVRKGVRERCSRKAFGKLFGKVFFMVIQYKEYMNNRYVLYHICISIYIVDL